MAEEKHLLIRSKEGKKLFKITTTPLNLKRGVFSSCLSGLEPLLDIWDQTTKEVHPNKELNL